MACRVAVIGGTGHLGYVREGLAQLEDLDVCAVACGSEEEDAGVLHRQLGGLPEIRVYQDYTALLREQAADIVAVLPRYHLHAEISCAALRSGAAVYCEKPLALTHESLEEVRTTQVETGRPIGMMLDYRYQPAFHTARKLVAAGSIGTPTVGYAQKSYKRGARPDFYRQRATFGGIIPWVGIHAIDWLRWVSGCDYRSVAAHHVKLHCPEYPEMEDAGTCLFELANGGSAVMSFDFLRPSGADSHGDDRLRLMGDQGALEIHSDGSLELLDASGSRRIVPETPPLGSFADFALSVIDPTHGCALPTLEAIRVTDMALTTRDAADRGIRLML